MNIKFAINRRLEEIGKILPELNEKAKHVDNEYLNDQIRRLEDEERRLREELAEIEKKENEKKGNDDLDEH